MTPNWANQTIWTGDNLMVMRGMNSGCVDLVYLDPPFNSNADYAAPMDSGAVGAAFRDTWTLSDIDVEWVDLIEAKHPALYRVLLAAMTDNDKSYLVYMAARLLEMRRILKDTGSIYLHCDPTMSHYLKLVMDAIFGRKNFINEIVWHYTGGGRSKHYFSRKHDIIFWYKRNTDPVFNIDAVRVPYKETSSYAKGGIRSRSGKHYKPHPKGTPVDDVWDIPIINPMADERTGYPTQKPLALLKRIILASSNEGDMILDPFCGCATACIAAEMEHRQWTGIDISPKAAELIMERMENEAGMFFKGAHRTDIPERTDMAVLKRYNHPDNRKRLYGEQGGNCTGCKTHFKIQNFQIDHIIARAKGGTDHINNLQLLCGNCNAIKGDRGMAYLKTRLQITA